MKIRGFTLIELLVTILISSFAIGLAGYVYITAFQNDMSTRFKMRSMNDANQLMTVLIEDFTRIGSQKILVQGSPTQTINSLFWDLANRDSSQFSFTNADTLDQFSFKAIRPSSTGALSGIDSVSYRVNSLKQLIRVCRFTPTVGTTVVDTLILADSVTTFDIRLGVSDLTLLSNPLIQKDTNTWRISTSTTLYPDTTPYTIDSGSLSFNAGSTYELSFAEIANDPYADYFDRILDTLRVGIFDNSGNQIPGTQYAYIYPTGDSVNRSFTFTPAQTVNSGRLIIYSRFTQIHPMGASIRFRNLILREKTRGNYDWRSTLSNIDTIAIRQKRSSQALELRIGIRVKNKTTQLTRIIPLPVNNL